MAIQGHGRQVKLTKNDLHFLVTDGVSSAFSRRSADYTAK